MENGEIERYIDGKSCGANTNWSESGRWQELYNEQEAKISCLLINKTFITNKYVDWIVISKKIKLKFIDVT